MAGRGSQCPRGRSTVRGAVSGGDDDDGDGRREGRRSRKHRELWGFRNRYGWWWICGCTLKSCGGLNRTSFAARERKIARSGVRRSAPMATAVLGTVRCGATRMMVQANRYALAAALNGKALEPWVRALHGCDNPACVRASLARRDRAAAHHRRLAARQHVDDGTRRPRRRPGYGAPRRSWSQGAPRLGGGATRSGTPRMGRRSRRGGTAGLNRPDTVVTATPATQSGHGSGWRRRANDGDRWLPGVAAAPVRGRGRWAGGGG